MWRQDALDLEAGQEEAWVIRASGKKLLEARIDQLRRVVTVHKLTHRAFTTSHWQDLRAQLAAWKVCRDSLFGLCFPSSARAGAGFC